MDCGVVMLTDEMKKIIRDHSAGMVATVNDAGMPVVTPKATFVVLDENTIAFGNIRSPGTLANIRHQPGVEVCFIDALTRKAVRVTGMAQIIAKAGAPPRLTSAFEEHWEDYLKLISDFVEITLTDVELILSPAYDSGIKEDDLRFANLAHLQALT